MNQCAFAGEYINAFMRDGLTPGIEPERILGIAF
jgi:hypothetical protein